MSRQILAIIDVEFMPEWESSPSDRCTRPSSGPPRRAEVRIILDGMYGYELQFGSTVRHDFYGDELWRDRETAIAFCESAAHREASTRIGPIKMWIKRVESC